MSDVRSVTRTCPLCEAMCGLVLDIDDDGHVVRVRGDRADPYSGGFLCPKGSLLGQVDADPDRVDRPHVQRDGRLVPVSWDEAFAEVARLLRPIRSEWGNDAVGLFQGNAIGHDVGITLFLPVLHRALGTRQMYSSATLDNMPHNVVAASMFGHAGTISVPDVDRTDLLVVVGGNPLVSNGSVGSAPGYPARLESLRRRGGRLVVIDPVESETARKADVHIAIRPGTDALMLLAIARVLFDEGLVELADLVDHVAGFDELEAHLAPFAVDEVARACGVESEQIRELARELAGATSAAVYGRLGTTLNRFGTLASWGLVLLNVLTGNLDRPGGMMFPESVGGSPTTRASRGQPEAVRFGRHHTVVRGAPEILGEFPAACLAEEVLHSGPDRLRGLVVLGGNPARSVPNSSAVEEALRSLEALICVGPYLDETSRFAHVVLPPAGPLARPHLDLLLTNYSLRNVAKYSSAARALRADELEEWRVIVRLAGAIDPDLERSDDEHLDERFDRLARSVARELGVDEAVVRAESGSHSGIERLLDLRVRSGPFGDGYGTRPDGLTLSALEAAGHTVDLGPLRSRIEEVVRTPSGHIELLPPVIAADLARLHERLTEEQPDLVMVGRRSLRSKNSWLHNIPRLVSGRPRCTLRLHPSDARRLGLDGADDALVSTDAGEVLASLEIDDGMAVGTCSLPHGWGHGVPGTGRRTAERTTGVNSNELAPDTSIDPLSGTAELNGIPVSVRAAPSSPPVPDPRGGTRP